MSVDAKSVLLVDDDEDILMVGEIALRDIGGLRTLTATNGHDALVLAASEQPDMILLDVMMPELDGPGTLRRLKLDDRCSDIPVVFVTARLDPGDHQRYAQLGAIGIVRKPFDPVKLPSQLQRLRHAMADCVPHN